MLLIGNCRIIFKQNFICSLFLQLTGNSPKTIIASGILLSWQNTKYSNHNNLFILPSEIKEQCGPIAEITASEPICWLNNIHSDYYPGNDLQREAINQLYKLGKAVGKIDDLNLQKDWQYLQTIDHIHLMDDQHPGYHENSNLYCIYKSKYDAFINYMNILDDFRLRLKEAAVKKEKKQIRSNEKNKKRMPSSPIYFSNNLLRKRKKSIDFFA